MHKCISKERWFLLFLYATGFFWRWSKCTQCDVMIAVLSSVLNDLTVFTPFYYLLTRLFADVEWMEIASWVHPTVSVSLSLLPLWSCIFCRFSLVNWIPSCKAQKIGINMGYKAFSSQRNLQRAWKVYKKFIWCIDMITCVHRLSERRWGDPLTSFENQRKI